MINIASLIEIMIDADGDRAARAFQNTAKEATKMAAIVGGISLATSALGSTLIAGLGGATAMFGTAGIAVVGFGALATTSIAGVVETTDELPKIQEKIDMAKQSGDAKVLF
ncbi:hypothetical protein ACQKNO_01315 [Bacillus paramycoides]|uniref:hypothetical protein n=1 Tax=Bacillus paramycoides TaxID=2026194 RepID=UPI003D0714FB